MILLVVLSGLAMWGAFPDQGWWPLMFVSLALLTGVVRRASAGWGAAYSALWAMVFFLPHISWMNIATNQTYLAWILLALAQAFFLALWGLSFAAVSRWPAAQTWWGEALAAATLWLGFEQIRARVPLGGFPWAKLPYGLVDSPLVHLAPWGGEVLVSAAAVVVAVWARRAVTGQWWLAVPALALFGAPALVPLETAPQNGTVNVLAVQGNVAIPMEETYAVAGQVTQNHVDETMRALEAGATPDLIIWGEDSIDRDPNTTELTDDLVDQVLERGQVPLVAGYQEYAHDERYNWYSVWYPGTGQGPDRYGKQHPVPWGEYVPWRSLSEFLATEAAAIRVDMASVDNPGLLPVTLADGRVVPLAVGICFEAGDEPIIAEGVRLGGEAIVIPTNNSQFRASAESTQQLQMARFRAAEFSRATLQVSTNGVSAVISPDGRVMAETDRQTAAHLSADIPLRTSLTPAARWETALTGGAMGLAVLLGIGGLVWGWRRRG